MRDLNKLTEDVREWGEIVGITGENGTGRISKQYRKLLEEVGELGEALISDDYNEIIDAIGDCVVVLILLSELNQTPLEECLEAAYDVIKDRIGNGKMVNGEFKKFK